VAIAHPFSRFAGKPLPGNECQCRCCRTSAPLGDCYAITCQTKGSLDLLSDTFGAYRKFHILAVNDDCCREILCLVPDISISGGRVVRELGALVWICGKRGCIVSNNGTEFTSKAILKCPNGDVNIAYRVAGER
jgi:transposase InsO family protein